MKHASGPSIAAFSSNPDYDFVIRTAIGHSVEGAADPGEVLAAVSGIRTHDHNGWFTAWRDLGERTLQLARSVASAGHRVSAAEAYLRASAYLGVAVNAQSSLKESTELAPTFALQCDAWEAFIDHTAVAVERVAIPYDGGTLPGYFFRPNARPDRSGATLVAVNGSDGSLAGMWASCIAAGLKRGYNVLVFDGPGQQSQLFDAGVPFRPDWESVLTPVFDFVSALDGVDAGRIALYGISQGGYWVCRAVTVEHRYAAVVADPGVVDVSTSWTDHLPKNLTKLLDEGERKKFDQEMAFGLKFSPGIERTWQFRARPYGAKGYSETLEAVRAYSITDTASSISTPLLITDPEGEQFWPGQSEQLAALTPNMSTLLKFTAAEGANEHCQPLARGLTAQRIFDWLDERLDERPDQ
ncbi:MAG: dipeptidyl aminopeptidase [Glaciihabitans sp.]|nr:dipeptidyl aminopeptidase [Glaciihabitans sp.]